MGDLVEFKQKDDNNYDFPVKVSSFYIDDLKGDDVVEVPGRKVVVRTDTNAVLGTVSDRYSLVPHADVVDKTKEILEKEKIEYKFTPHVTKGGARFHGSFDFPEIKSQVAVGDVVSLRMTLNNSYDKWYASLFNMGALRLLCLNGMTALDSLFKSRDIHSGVMLSTEEVLGPLSNAVKVFKGDFIPKLKNLTKVKLTADEAGAFLDAADFPKFYMKQIRESLENDAILKRKQINLWAIYNAFTQVATHRAKSYETSQRLGGMINKVFKEQLAA